MKKYILLFAIIAGFSYAQDAPSGYTEHYGLRKYAENANPSADSLNQNWTDVDETLYDLIVSTDEDQLAILDDVLTFSDSLSGIGTFTTTATTCTVTVSDMSDDDVVMLTPIGTAYDADDMLKVSVGNGSFIVTRNSSGTSGLEFFYLWIKK
jgi:hypothetical protein